MEGKMNMNKTNLKTVANEFGMSVEKFLQFYRQNPGGGLPGKLPGQLPGRSFSEEQDRDIDLGLNFDALRKSSAWRRIKRAARFGGQTAKEFVTHSIMEMVRTSEDDMVLSPRTGEPICDILELEEFVMKSEH
jgi:hypothetical protein